MRIGMNMLLWTPHVTEAHFPVFEKLKGAGYDGVEIPLFEGDESHYRKVGEALRRVGLACTTITVCNAGASAVSGDEGERGRSLERLKWCLDMSAAVGSELLCGPYHAPLGVFTGGEASEVEKGRAVEVLRAGAEYGGKVGVKVAIEYLNRFETYFLNTARDAEALVSRVGHAYLGMMYDTFHANIEEKDPVGALEAVAGRVIHVHISENDRGTPGSGHVDWGGTFRALRKMKYEGWLTIEAFSRAMPELAAATRVWRDFFPSQEDVYVGGIKFIRRMWEEGGR